MKLNAIVLACAALAAAGCVSVTRSDVEKAFVKYQLVNPSMTREEVLALLGKPQAVDPNGVAHWKTRATGDELTAELDLSFGNDGRVAQLSRRKHPLPAARVGWIEPAEGITPPPRKDHEGTSGDPLSDHDYPPLH